MKKERDKIRKKEHIERTAAFWTKVFKHETFTDKNMGERDGIKDDGKYPHYKIYKVTKEKKLSGSPPGLFVVHYKPNVDRKTLQQMTDEEIKFRTDYIPLHEAMDLKDLSHIKKLYKKEYNHFKQKYRYGYIDVED
tara:strand:- start:801 stop:1208 length:408 start_codon:yes stop_codon:yes gene_type:complete